MPDLEDGRFDLIFTPVSNVFCPEVAPIWAECSRLLAPGGHLLAGFMNPDFYLFDHDAIEQGGAMEVVHSLPYNDLESKPVDEVENQLTAQLSVEFSHSWEERRSRSVASATPAWRWSASMRIVGRQGRRPSTTTSPSSG